MFHYSIQIDWPSQYLDRAYGYDVDEFDSLILLSKAEVLTKIKSKKILDEVKEFWYLNKFPTEVHKPIQIYLSCFSDNHSCRLTISPIGENQETKQTNNIMSSAFSAFRKKTAQVDCVYLKPKEIDGTIKIRVLPWILSRSLTNIHFYYEGWHDIKEKGKDVSKCIRFPFNEDGGYDVDDDVKWSRGDYGVQKPKGAFVCVILNMTEEKVQIFSGTQKTLLGPLGEFCDPEADRYIENWMDYSLILTKDKNTDKFTVEREQLKKSDLPDWAIQSLEDFHFDMDDYMACQKTPEGQGKTWNDVQDLIGDRPHQGEKSNEEPKSDFEEVKNWGDVKTPKGKILRQCALEELQNMQKILDKKETTDKNGVLYRAILTGIKANEQPAFDEAGMSPEDVDF